MLANLHKRSIPAALFAAALILSGAAWAPAAQPPSEAEIKAVLLFHLTQFVTWPPPTSNAAPEFVIGILGPVPDPFAGPDPFAKALEAVVKGEKVGKRPIRVVRFNRAQDLVGCPLVYVSPLHRQPLSRVFEQLKDPPALTVGETEGFLEEGGMLRFKRTAQSKIRFEVALQHVRRQGMNISAQLLRVCDVVDPKPRP